MILAFAKVAGHHIITWLIIGLVAGLVASRVVRGTGLGMVRDIIVGLVGAVIGGLILHAVRGGSHASPSVLIEIVVAFVGAVILLIIAKAMDRKRVSSFDRVEQLREANNSRLTASARTTPIFNHDRDILPTAPTVLHHAA